MAQFILGALRAAISTAGVLFLVFLPGTAAASSFGIAPTGLELTPARRIEVLTVHNQGDAPALLQVRAVAWSQPAGEEHYEDTHELLIAPPVFQLAAGAEQVIRVALRREPDAARELSYRVIVQEVPPAAPLAGSGLKVALRLTLPVFVSPLQPAAPPQLVWVARRVADHLQISATNPGRAHVQIQRFEVRVPGAAPVPVTTARYVLPGSEITWPAALATALPPGAILGIQGESNRGAFTANAALASP
jgi:fimbrial chaperone protein